MSTKAHALIVIPVDIAQALKIQFLTNLQKKVITTAIL